MNDELAFDLAKARMRLPHGIGQFARPNDARGAGSPRVVPWRDTRATIALVNALQAYATRETRLGIPILFHEEALHGYHGAGATSFPQAIALASTWDRELVRAVNAVTAREIRARGAHLALSPVVDVARDPRWGRIEETFGEDPYLVGEMGVAAVAGPAGRQPRWQAGRRQGVRHAQAHDRPRPAGERHQHRPGADRRARPAGGLLPAVRAGREADRRPGGDAVVQRDRRRAEPRQPLAARRRAARRMGLRGRDRQRLLRDRRARASSTTLPRTRTTRRCRRSTPGVDVELPDGEAYATLPQQVRTGASAQAQLDAAVRRHARAQVPAPGCSRIRLPTPKLRPAIDRQRRGPRAGARSARERSIVLLKNDGVLPLALPERGRKPTSR